MNRIIYTLALLFLFSCNDYEEVDKNGYIERRVLQWLKDNNFETLNYQPVKTDIYDTIYVVNYYREEVYSYVNRSTDITIAEADRKLDSVIKYHQGEIAYIELMHTYKVQEGRINKEKKIVIGINENGEILYIKPAYLHKY